MFNVEKYTLGCSGFLTTHEDMEFELEPCFAGILETAIVRMMVIFVFLVHFVFSQAERRQHATFTDSSTVGVTCKSDKIEILYFNFRKITY